MKYLKFEMLCNYFSLFNLFLHKRFIKIESSKCPF